MINCPKCNFDNELGRIFCHQCGTKLDLDQIKPPSRGGKSLRKKGTGGVARTINWMIRLVVLGGLVLMLALMAQVPSLAPITSTPKDLESFYRKRNNLEAALGSRKPVAITLTAAELNAYITHTPFEEAQGSGVKVQPTRLQIDFGDDQVTAAIFGKIKFGASWEKQLGITYTVAPQLVDGRLRFQPVVAHLGKLPVPKWLLEKTHFIQGYYEQLFHNLSAEQQLLNQLSRLGIEPASALLEYEPAPKPQG